MAGRTTAIEAEKTPLEIAASEAGGVLARTAEDLVAATFPHADFSEEPTTLTILQLAALHSLITTTSQAVMNAPQLGELPYLAYKALVNAQAAVSAVISTEFDKVNPLEQEQIGQTVARFRSIVSPPSRR